MTKSIVVTSSTFNAKLSGFVKSQVNQRDNLQSLIVFGLEHYGEHGDTAYLSKVMQACVGVRSLPTETLKGYIKQHANVRLEKDSKSGVLKFKKEGKEAEVVMPTKVWYDWEGAKHHATPDVDAIARIATIKTTLNKALKEGTLKDGQEQYVKDLLAAINSVKVEPTTTTLKAA